MGPLILRFTDSERADLALDPGVHAIGRDDNGEPCRVDDAMAAIAQICVDRRGVWLQVREGARGLYVNGRPVRRMAMLRSGDAVFIDGVELLLCGDPPLPAPPAGWPEFSGPVTPAEGQGTVLRGIGGPHHGRCFAVDHRLTIGGAPDSDVRIDGMADDTLVCLEQHADAMVLRGPRGGTRHVNGWPVDDALLRPGDQLVLDAQHRFVVEASVTPVTVDRSDASPVDEPGFGHAALVGGPRSAVTASVRRLPWLLLAAALLSIALSLLLMYGVR